MHEIAAVSRLSVSSSFMQRARESIFIVEYETPRLPLRVYKKASLSKDCLGLARSRSIPDFSICLSFFAFSLTSFRQLTFRVSYFSSARTIFDFLKRDMKELRYSFPKSYDSFLFLLLVSLSYLYHHSYAATYSLSPRTFLVIQFFNKY